MPNQFTLDEQAQIIGNILHWKRRQFTNLQIEQLEAVERTLHGLMDLRAGLVATKQDEGDERCEDLSNEMANGLIDLLHLQRA
jgi:hypothetical protein